MIIRIQEGLIETAVAVNKSITEFDQAYDRKYFEDRCASKEKLILIAYADNLPAGYMVAYDKNGDGSFYCWMAGVDPLFRRQGILNRMMQYLFAWAQDHKYERITIKTRNNRREMLAYLVKAGFSFTGVESLDNTDDNRILLEKII